MKSNRQLEIISLLLFKTEQFEYLWHIFFLRYLLVASFGERPFSIYHPIIFRDVTAE